MIVWIVILLLAIGTFAAAYFSSRNWHWADVTLSVLIFLMGVVGVLLQAKVVQIRAVYGKKIAASEKQLATLENGVEALDIGTRDSQILGQLRGQDVRVPDGTNAFGGIPEVDHKLYMQTRLRGRTWNRVAPGGPLNPETGTIPVAIEAPGPHGLEINTIVYAFESGPAATPNPDEGPQYLGEFQVADAGEGGVSLKPVQILDDYEKDRLGRSRGPWILYETLPVDQHEVFAGIPPEVLQNSFPPASAEEYVRHGTEANADDDQWHRAAYDESGKRLGPEDAANADNLRYLYERPLRDYDFLFQELLKTRTILWADREAVSEDNAKLAASLESAKALQAFREDEIEKLTFDLNGMQQDRQAIEQHLTAVRRQIAQLKQRNAGLMRENKALLNSLVERQLPNRQFGN